MSASVRPPAVAGFFYPGEANELRETVDALLESAPRKGSTEKLKALIVPHAGYAYSGPVAAVAYKLLQAIAERVRRIVLLGPAHRVAFAGLALPGCERMATPLGEVAVDLDGAAAARALPFVRESARAHAREHSLEVQLPFLQRLFEAVPVVPLCVGDAAPAEVGAALAAVWGGGETIVVISSDLSHYLPYAFARATDERTARAVLAGEFPINPEQACGAHPVNGLLSEAARRAMRAELLDLRNSGDTAGDKRQVVGYGAFAFYEA